MQGRNRVPEYFPKPLPEDSPMQKLLPTWHNEFLSQIPSSNELFTLLSCASYLEAETLATVLSVKVAKMMQKCENLDQMRMFLGITNDYTPEQEKQLKSGQISLWTDQKTFDRDFDEDLELPKVALNKSDEQEAYQQSHQGMLNPTKMGYYSAVNSEA